MNKKKIGLLTMPILDNYGGIIQIAALYHILEVNNFCPVLINKRYNQSSFKVFVKYLISNNPFYKIYDYNDIVKRKHRLDKLTSFISDFFVNRSNPIYKEKDLKSFIKDIDTVVVGSDQVWRYRYVKENYKHYFLSFVGEGTKKVSYAASFGVDYWEGSKESENYIGELLKRFTAVSVREGVGVDICREVFKFSNAQQVLDPTFLPNVEFYNSIIGKEAISKKIYVFNYVLDTNESMQTLVKNIAKFRSMEINTIGLNDSSSKGGSKPSIAEWLYHFREADFVVTDSFHGTVFSIIFNKQFIAIGNKTRGIARFESLLSIFGLESRLISEDSLEQLEEILSDNIDYKKVNLKLDIERTKSLDFLLKSLN